MRKKDVVKTKKVLKKDNQVIISVRVSKDLKAWIVANNFSCTKIFVHACEELGYTP